MDKTSTARQIAHAKSLGLSSLVEKAILRGFFELSSSEVKYNIHRNKKYRITDPEEIIRADTIAYLIITLGYDPKCIDTEILGSHGDYADIVLFKDKRCTDAWAVIETKKETATKSEKDEGIGQAFANAIALKAKYAVFDFGKSSTVWVVEGYGAKERVKNKVGSRRELPKNYEELISWHFIAGSSHDISPSDTSTISAAVRKAHAIIWAGGKRDPLSAFDEWSKIMFAKVRDERHTANGEPRKFQLGIGDSITSVSTRVHELFEQAKSQDPTIFPNDESLDLPDTKIAAVVETIQEISFMDTDSDIIGTAFEDFFGTVFRGNLGQYFTMRPIARFVVNALNIDKDCYVLDPTCGSGGFLLETLLQVWRDIEQNFKGQRDLDRIKTDFALQNVYGIEIHSTLARICKISLLLHHDGHTNIEADKSCLSPNLSIPRLKKEGSFNIIVGNPPFGTKIEEGDEDQLDGASLSDFTICEGMTKVPSEQIILEKSVSMLAGGGRLGMVLPDGVLNNSGVQSNCPSVREWLCSHGRILGIVSLPDYAFRRSGATNKTSVLLYEKFTPDEDRRMGVEIKKNPTGNIATWLKDSGLDYNIFFAEADFIGYTPSGKADSRNDLFSVDDKGFISKEQPKSILGAYRQYLQNQTVKNSKCVVKLASSIWDSHSSHRLDPKFHVYQEHENEYIPVGWKKKRLGEIVERRKESVNFSSRLNDTFNVLTLSQTGEPRFREAGVGNNPPEWLGMYFEDSSSSWYVVHKGDIVYSGIDLWKGVVCHIPPEMDGALVTQEYPILQVIDDEIDPEYLAILLRSRRFRRVFRAINTGHSNRRRTQSEDFANVLIYYPPRKEQKELSKKVHSARNKIKEAYNKMAEIQDSIDILLMADDEWDFEEDTSESANQG